MDYFRAMIGLLQSRYLVTLMVLLLTAPNVALMMQKVAMPHPAPPQYSLANT